MFRQAAQSYSRVLQISRAARAVRNRTPTQDGARHSVPAQTGNAHTLEVLTRREREVAALLADGRTNQEIAELLVIERGTVANHVGHILHKLGASNRTQVAVLVRPVHRGG
jgi:DNA-binding NarL/FixJ family response regulator